MLLPLFKLDHVNIFEQFYKNKIYFLNQAKFNNYNYNNKNNNNSSKTFLPRILACLKKSKRLK